MNNFVRFLFDSVVAANKTQTFKDRSVLPLSPVAKTGSCYAS